LQKSVAMENKNKLFRSTNVVYQVDGNTIEKDLILLMYSNQVEQISIQQFWVTFTTKQVKHNWNKRNDTMLKKNYLFKQVST